MRGFLMNSTSSRRNFLRLGAAAVCGLSAGFSSSVHSGNFPEKSYENNPLFRKIPARFRQTDIFVSGSEGYNTYRIPALIVSKTGIILAFCEGRRDSSSDTGQIDLVLKRSVDGGKTWHPMQTVVSERDMTCGNPAPVVDRSTGTIWLLLTKNPSDTPERDILDGKGSGTRTVWVTKSTDEGATWAKPKDITRDVKEPSWTWYATGPCHGIQLKNGRLVIPCDFVHGSNHDYSESAYSHLIYSDDGGAIWKIGGIAQKGTNESTVVQTASGALYLNSRAYHKTGTRFHSWSYNNGNSLTDFGEAKELVEPVCQASIIRFTEENYYAKNRILFSNPAGTTRDHMRVRLSYDECRTWPVSKLLNEGPSAYSDLAIAPDMSILCFYERGVKNPYEKISLAQFNLEWLTDNEDSLLLK